MNSCACGCGKPTKLESHIYVHGHNQRKSHTLNPKQRYKLNHPDKIKHQAKEYREQNKDRLRAKAAARTPEQRNAEWLRWKAKHPQGNRKRFLKENYGLSMEEFECILVLQNNKCALCFDRPKYTLRIDHNHETGKVRGLLCANCNTGTGHVERFLRLNLLDKVLSHVRRK